MTRPEWYRDIDGIWRNPRYPKSKSRQHPEVEINYDDTTNGATLSIGETHVALTFGELQCLMNRIFQVNKQVQEENSILWKEKEAIMMREDGYEPHVNRRR